MKVISGATKAVPSATAAPRWTVHGYFSNCGVGGAGNPEINASAPPPCQDDWGNVDTTLESLGTNILSVAEQKIRGLTSQDISALSGTIQSDITSEMNTIMATGTGEHKPAVLPRRSLRSGYHESGHFC